MPGLGANASLVSVQVTVLSVAGISAESGVPTFRDVETGLWAKVDPYEISSAEGLRAHPEKVSGAVQEDNPPVVPVLSGNRNFEGRINPDIKMNYLASPPLVIAYALAGTMDWDFEKQPLGKDEDGNDV